jgi:hypothetical protein
VPSPFALGAIVAVPAIGLTTLGTALRPELDGGDIGLQLLWVAAAYLGGLGLTVTLAPRLIPVPGAARHLGARFASAAVLPLLASGALGFIPLAGLGVLWTVAGTGLATWSGWLGSSDLLGLEGPGRSVAAIAPAATCGAPILILHLVRTVAL